MTDTETKDKRLRTLIELVGLVAVVGSLLLVAFQIQQANRIAQATTLYEIVRDINQFNDMGASDSEFAALLVELTDSQSELSQIHAQQAQLLAFRFLNIWVTQEIAYRNGLFTEDQFGLTKADVTSVLADYPRIAPFIDRAMQAQPGFADYEVLRPFVE